MPGATIIGSDEKIILGSRVRPPRWAVHLARLAQSVEHKTLITQFESGNLGVAGSTPALGCSFGPTSSVGRAQDSYFVVGDVVTEWLT